MYENCVIKNTYSEGKVKTRESNFSEILHFSEISYKLAELLEAQEIIRGILSDNRSPLCRYVASQLLVNERSIGFLPRVRGTF